MNSPDPHSPDNLPGLIKLSTGQDGLRGLLGVKSIIPKSTENPDNLPIVDFIASDATLDRDNEIIDAAGWRLENYRKNPVFQNAHQYGDISYTLGKALQVEVRHSPDQNSPDPFLYHRILFAVDANPLAKIAYELYKGGFLHAVSVGFVPIRWENGTQQSGYRRRYLEQELLELSAVAVPANPNALALGVKSGAVATADIQAAVDLLETLKNALPSASSACSAGKNPISSLEEASAIHARATDPAGHFAQSDNDELALASAHIALINAQLAVMRNAAS